MKEQKKKRPQGPRILSPSSDLPRSDSMWDLGKKGDVSDGSREIVLHVQGGPVMQVEVITTQGDKCQHFRKF